MLAAMLDYANILNEKQLMAAQHVGGPMLVIAGAGSGKTRVVTYRIAYLLEQGIPAHQILALTFTNKAAEEMKTRLFDLCHQYLLVSTFHSLGARILRESIAELGWSAQFSIIDEADQERLIKGILKDLEISDRQLTAKEAKWNISRAKNDLALPNTMVIETEEDELVQKVYAKYQERLQQYANVDFDDLLLLPNLLFQEKPEIKKEYQNRWRYLLIDEYQDTNHAQYQLARHIVGEVCNLFVVGDPDQSIYSWRGADIGNILSFEKDFAGAKIIKLEQNYRSTETILQAANQLIQENASRYEKELWSTMGQGELIEHHCLDSDREEASFISRKIQEFEKTGTLSNIVIFYRTNGQSRSLEDSLIDHGIPYVIIGGISFYDRREIKDILALLRLIQCDTDFLSFERVVKFLKLSLGPRTLEKIRLILESEKTPIVPLLQRLQNSGEIRLTGKQKFGIERIVELLTHFRTYALDKPLSALLQEMVIESGYLGILKEDPETFEDRKENLDSLMAKAVEREDQGSIDIASFLNDIALKTSLEESNTSHDRVRLMTLHNGKGLEFDIVFMAGMEEDLFPHVNSKYEHDSIEEERRLCYVGMTRARKRLFLTNCKQRFLWGQLRRMEPSRFLKEIPKEYIKVHSPYSSYEIQDETLTIDQDLNFSFEQGDMVFHPEFGNGIVSRIYEGSFGPMAEVEFAKDKIKRTLALQYAPLQKVT